MRAIQFDFADPQFPASFVDVPRPELPNDQWVRIEVSAGGICGSDLHLFTGSTGNSPTLFPFAAFPFIIGHEIAGVVTEAGDDARIEPGTRVAVMPTMTCEARGIDPPCRLCAAGFMSSCQNLDHRQPSKGQALGFTKGLGGGWADEVVAHRSMVFELPGAVSDRAASLHEPLSIALHGLERRRPPTGAPIVIVGAGIIGLAALAAVRHAHPDTEVTVVARHDHQAAAARRLGAHHVVRPQPEAQHFEELAAISGARATGKGQSAMLTGGFPYVIEAVGTASAVTEALRIADNRADVLLLGAAGTAEVDLTPVWWKELVFAGAINHTHESESGAIRLLAEGGLPDDVVVTHEFGLDEYRTAVETALDKTSGAIKVVFRPGG